MDNYCDWDDVRAIREMMEKLVKRKDEQDTSYGKYREGFNDGMQRAFELAIYQLRHHTNDKALIRDMRKELGDIYNVYSKEDKNND